MACIATVEYQPDIFRLTIRRRQVAFLTGHANVQPGQRIARFAVIEFSLRTGNRLPVVEVVALCAVLTEAALVLVLMARHAPTRHAQKRAADVFH